VPFVKDVEGSILDMIAAIRSGSAPTNHKASDATWPRDLVHAGPLIVAGQVLMADKGYRAKEFEAFLSSSGITLVRPAMGNEPPRPGQRFLKPFRQIIESVNQTLKAQLDLEREGVPLPASLHGSGNACLHSRRRSGTTKTPGAPCSGPLPLTTTEATPWN
jgi:hypothetical protein